MAAQENTAAESRELKVERRETCAQEQIGGGYPRSLTPIAGLSNPIPSLNPNGNIHELKESVL